MLPHVQGENHTPCLEQKSPFLSQKLLLQALTLATPRNLTIITIIPVKNPGSPSQRSHLAPTWEPSEIAIKRGNADTLKGSCI